MATSALNERNLIARIDAMQRGESAVYYVGHLATDSFFDPDVAKLRDTVQRLSDMVLQTNNGELHRGMGIVTLTQKRVGDDFEYAVKKM